MDALLSSVNHTSERLKWGLLAHTTAMFSFVTIFTAINLDIQSISYIDNRDFAGDDIMFPPGPLGYQFLIYSKAISVVPNVMFYLNTCLADGLLVSSVANSITQVSNMGCSSALSMPYHLRQELLGYCLPMHHVPCLFWYVFGSSTIQQQRSTNAIDTAMGIAFIFQISQTISINSNSVTIANFGTPYYSISISLNVLLTLMIVTRLVLYNRNVRNAMGAPVKARGLYNTAVTILIESCALYAVSYILFIGPWAIGSPVSNIFFPILAETQVRAFFTFPRPCGVAA